MALKTISGWVQKLFPFAEMSAKCCKMGKVTLNKILHYCAVKNNTIMDISFIVSADWAVLFTHLIWPKPVFMYSLSTGLKYQMSNCTLPRDKGYLSTVQLDLFETANIRLKVPHRLNRKSLKPLPKPEKGLKTVFS
jgi:hypothetical protein